MSIWKRNAVVVAIVLFVGAAVYLNWSYNNSQADPQQENQGKVMGQASMVSGTDKTSQDNDAAQVSSAAGEKQAEGQSQQEQEEKETGYFATARLNRQQSRDSALELLQKAAEDADADQTMVDEANQAIQTMAAFTLSEAQVENMVVAKGYGDCVCFLNENSVSVVVSKVEDGLTESDVAKIVEIVRQETGLGADQIKIVEAQP